MKLADIYNTPRLSKQKSMYLNRKLIGHLQLNKGKSEKFVFSVGERVLDIATWKNAIDAGTIKSVYRENGFNKVETEKGFYRECDLIKA